MKARRLVEMAIMMLLAAVFGGQSTLAADGDIEDLVNRKVLRVCSDPANLPFSDRHKKGFENRIAEIIAEELGGIPVEYTWFPQATGFVRRTLAAKRCDVIMGYAQGDELVLNTNHYYVSTYALVYRKGTGLDGMETIGDKRLKGKRVGIVAGTPPASIAAKHGLMQDAKFYRRTVDRRYESPAEEMVADIKSGEVVAGLLWGPIAGYYGKRAGDDFVVVPLLKETIGPRTAYRITMGVRQGDVRWKRELNEIIKKRQEDINNVLREFGVPIIAPEDDPITKASRQ